jgi:hypothetical protein
MAFYYQEKQNFRKPGTWIFVSATMLPVNGVLLYGLYQQLVLGEPWGSEPNSDISLILVTLIIMIFSAIIFWLILSVELVVEIKDKAVYYQFRPFKNKVINFSDLLSWEVKSIKPIFGFAGYGLRITTKSKAYIVNGKNALFLKPKKGKQIVIDTINPEGIKASMTKQWQRFEEH